MQEALAIAPQLAIVVAILGLVVWLQRQNSMTITALKREAKPDQITKRLDSLDAGLERVTDQIAGLTVQVAKLATDVRWMRSAAHHRAGHSEGPDS